MHRTLVINDTLSIPIRLTFGAMRLYRAEFNGDLITDLSAAQDALHPDPIRDALKNADLSGLSLEEMQTEIMKHIDIRELNQTRLPSAETQEKALRCVWALAKNADPKLPAFGAWCDSFEILLPLPAMVEACVGMLSEASGATVELKN